ncbi:MAG TPA: hypothetical protein VF752_07065 [Thermoleophilaceae bacterium]
MDENSRLIALIRSLSERSLAESDALATTLGRRCWPGGGDRADPHAAEWVRRWHPRSMPVPVHCSCAAGRCLVCN